MYSYELYNYSLEKYGALLNATKHFETIEIRDQKNRLILPKGKIVDSDFSIPNPSNPLTDLTGNAIRIGISYYEYETRLNENKRDSNLYDAFRSISREHKNSYFLFSVIFNIAGTLIYIFSSYCL